MNWDAFKTYELGYRDAFEALNNQLFERYVYRRWEKEVVRFQSVNGAGGDGGVEAYAMLSDGSEIGVQAKWFRHAMDDREIRQIKNSVATAKRVRPELAEYIICVPHNPSPQKVGKGGVITKNHEEARIQEFTAEMAEAYPDLKLTWWFDEEILSELQQPNNDGIFHHWFVTPALSLNFLKDHFNVQRHSTWLKQRYVPELNGYGKIDDAYQRMTLSTNIRRQYVTELTQKIALIRNAHGLIVDFLETEEFAPSLNILLRSVFRNLRKFSICLKKLRQAFRDGNDTFIQAVPKERKIWPAIMQLERMAKTHRQKAIAPRLIKQLQRLHQTHLSQYLDDFQKHLSERIKLVRGGAGTGKTQGLAHCVHQHLTSNIPAIIIRAKGTPCGNWSEILAHSLELPGWNKTQVLSSLEATAVSADVLKAAGLEKGEAVREPSSKVLVCVDGLEEEVTKQTEWCSRLSETLDLVKSFPRLRFLFSARDYFEHECIDPYEPSWESVSLAREGDVPLDDIAERYLIAYGVILPSLSILKGIDSLLALRLFCELYRGQTLDSHSRLLIATRDLLNRKIAHINSEFLEALPARKSQTQQPVHKGLLAIAEYFYHQVEAHQTDLEHIIASKLGEGFTMNEVQLLLDNLVQHGILIRTAVADEAAIIEINDFIYEFTYQSIIEHILSEKIYSELRAAKIETIPKILHQRIAQPITSVGSYDPFALPPNQKITRSIVSRLFAETGRLIGDDGFLKEGLSDADVLEMRFEALVYAPQERLVHYKTWVDELFLAGGWFMDVVLRLLILPSCGREDGVFGARYVHEHLIRQTSAFERDKMWSGLDEHEAHLRKEKRHKNPVKEALNPLGNSILILSEWENFDERPLLYAWALTNIDQSFRHALRIALTDWAIKRAEEFIKLLDLVYPVNDPQLQEDLAAIALGLATHINEHTLLKSLADWSLQNVFAHREAQRNVVVRQGFRAGVEKAFRHGAITRNEVLQARPLPLTLVDLLPLSQSVLGGNDQYPIGHDLDWYVIKKAYEPFLEHPSGSNDSLRNNDTPLASVFLQLFRDQYGLPDLYSHGWAVAAAVEYIRTKLGFTRTEGSSWTKASHGGKSEVFSYEEKYTWLAVRYLQGYLADYVPLKSDTYNEDGEEEDVHPSWIQDYSLIMDMHNPSEDLLTDRKINRFSKGRNRWIIKEDLAPTVSLTGNVSVAIKDWVEIEPQLNFSNWLRYASNDFGLLGRPGSSWLALHTSTSLLEAAKVGYCLLDATACLIAEHDFEDLRRIIENGNHLHFLSHIDTLHANPDTDTYSNPSDLVWMEWIGEDSNAEKIIVNGRECELFYTLTEVTQGGVSGERYHTIPSKKVRSMLKIESFLDGVMSDNKGNIVAFAGKISEEAYRDKQEWLLADETVLLAQLQTQRLRLVWFVHVFKKKNPLNDDFKKEQYTQRSRKYLVWLEGGQWHSVQFWNSYWSNR